MSILIWDEKYCVGIGEFDRQHQKFFMLVNHLYDAVERNDGKELIERKLKGIEEFYNHHFFSEEKYMEAFSYPDFEFHRKVHRSFIENADKHMAEYNKSGKVPHEFLEYLRDWWTEHILKTDKRYQSFFNSRGLL
ncbi:bacteriohemerythrin [Candidatus Riflebacteria bacterium]